MRKKMVGQKSGWETQGAGVHLGHDLTPRKGFVFQMCSFRYGVLQEVPGDTVMTWDGGCSWN